jgi:hypothetical protein
MVTGMSLLAACVLSSFLFGNLLLLQIFFCFLFRKTISARIQLMAIARIS